MNQLLKKVIIYFPGSIIPAILSLITSYIFTRTFKAEEYGLYAYYLSLAFPVKLFIFQWIQQSITRFLPQMSKSEIFNFKLNISKIILYQSLVFSLLWISISTFITNKSFYLLVGAIVISSSTLEILFSILQSEMKAKIHTLYRLLSVFTIFLIRIILYFLISYKNPIIMLYSILLSDIICIPFLLNKSSMKNPLGKITKINLKLIYIQMIPYFRYGLPMVGWILSGTLLSIGDRYLIKYFFTMKEVGIYAANYNLIIGSVALLIMPITLTLHPFLMKSKDLNIEKTKIIIGSIIEVMFILGSILSLYIYVFSEEIAFILGKEYQSGHKMMPYMIIGIIIWNISLYAHKPLEFSNKTITMFKLSFLAAFLNFLLNFIFLPRIGFEFAAITTIISYAIYFLLVSYIGKKEIKWEVNTLMIFLIIVLTIIISISLKIFKNLLKYNINEIFGILFIFIVSLAYSYFIIYNVYRFYTKNHFLKFQ